MYVSQHKDFVAHLNKVQEELLHYPIGVSKMMEASHNIPVADLVTQSSRSEGILRIIHG